MGCCHDKNSKLEQETDLSSSRNFKRSTSLIENIKRQYKFKEKLNQGGYSVVYSAENINSGETRAVKCIPISSAAPEKIKLLTEEILILQELDHPNILQILDVFQDRQFIYIVTEQCRGGELFDRILEKGHFSETQAASYMLQMVSAVNYLHSKKIMHRDLKPENMMFETKDFESNLKLIDFGSSKHFIDGLPTAERLGSAYYIAPEVLAGHYDQKCDVWSLGVILHILLSGFPPFAGNNDYEIFHNIQYSEVSFTDRCWSKVSKEAVDLIKIMLQKNPLDRPTAAWVFQSPWLQKFRKNLLPDALFSSATLSNLSQFSVSSKLMKASLNFIAKHLMTGEEVENIRKLFEKIDKNGDGILNSEEIQEALKNCPGDLLLNVENIMKKVQEDTDGGIRYSEFLTAAIDWDKELSRDRLKKAFMEFDKDGNGSISIDELMKTLGGQQEQAHIFIQMMKEADFDGNGEIDLEEFCTFMLQRKYIKSL